MTNKSRFAGLAAELAGQDALVDPEAKIRKINQDNLAWLRARGQNLSTLRALLEEFEKDADLDRGDGPGRYIEALRDLRESAKPVPIDYRANPYLEGVVTPWAVFPGSLNPSDETPAPRRRKTGK